MITVDRIEGPVNKDTGKTELLAIHVVVDKEDLKSFIELVQRGSNLWPDATPVIKEYADMITTGQILQDYRSQDTSKPRRSYKIARIVQQPHNDAMLVVCSCGVSEEMENQVIAYQCKNCKTNHIIKDYVK